MKRYALAVALISGLIYAGCKSGNKSSMPTDSVPSKTIDEAKMDPDTTDTIPVEYYDTCTFRRVAVDTVREGLQKRYADDLSKKVIDSMSRRFMIYEYDLNDDGIKEIFVGFTGPYFCGSGGCSFLIMDNAGKVITQFSVSDYPIIIANSKTNGWKDLIIQSNHKNHIMRFNGTKYPSNPSIQPVFDIPPGNLKKVLNYPHDPYPMFRF
ncbi:hypothetical protein [Mucilaginibacter agri]|uniref:Uncharacterized protein n=1 Tax=Mucilaginibacter agri TaxID=2695265 RepID=A0A966DV62_9SPHI|nr:hypothetical protein [Mucilaginibacter agri]NCD71156.1 hypothetical protein [Mucilaginibacter agri]